MAKIRNTSGTDLIVPWLDGRLVDADEVVDVDPILAPAYLCQPGTWEAADAAAETLAALTVQDAPARNASTEVWRAWSAMQPGVAPDDVADATRDELVATYAPPPEPVAPAPEEPAPPAPDPAPAPAAAPAVPSPTTTPQES